MTSLSETAPLSLSSAGASGSLSVGALKMSSRWSSITLLSSTPSSFPPSSSSVCMKRSDNPMNAIAETGPRVPAIAKRAANTIISTTISCPITPVSRFATVPHHREVFWAAVLAALASSSSLNEVLRPQARKAP